MGFKRDVAKVKAEDARAKGLPDGSATVAGKYFAEHGTTPDTNRDFWAWVKGQPPAVQQQVLTEGGQNFSQLDKQNAFRAGILVPGVDEAGNGSGLSKGEVSTILTGK